MLLEKRHLELQAKARQALLDAEMATDHHARLTRLGWYAYLSPPSDVRTLCVVREELAYRNPALDSVYAVQGLGSYPLHLAGRSELTQSVADGRALFAFALTEEDAGSDVAALATTARKDGNDYILDGKKRFISNAGIATHYTVFARTSPGPRGLSAFVVPAEKVSVTPMALMGEHPIGEVTLKSCRVPASARLGEEGQGMRLALGTLDVFRTTVGAAAVGMAQRALDEAVSYAKSRKQFGAPLAELQGVQFLLAESATELEAARLLVHHAAAVKDAGADRVTYEAAIAKLFSTEAAQRIIDRCLQVHGGNGVVKGFAVERLYRDIRALRIYEGASEVQKVVIARQLLGARVSPG